MKELLGLEGVGVSVAMEGHIMVTARKLFNTSSAAAKEALVADGVIPDFVTEQVVQDAWGGQVPGDIAAAAEGVVRSKHASSRGCDVYIKTHRATLNSQVEEVSSVGQPLRQKGKKMICKRIAWEAWSKETKTTQEHFKQKYQDSVGSDRLALATLVEKAEEPDDLLTPKTRRTHGLGMALLGATKELIMSGSKQEKEAAKVIVDKAAWRLTQAKNAKQRATDVFKRARSRAFPKVDWVKLQRTLGKTGAGRPKGSQSITDGELVSVLKAYSVESCRWSKKGDQVLRTLTDSKRRTHFALPQRIKNKLQYRQVCARLKQARLGFAGSCKMVDMCSVCHAWRTMIGPWVTTVLRDAEVTVLSKCPAALDDMGERDIHFRNEQPSFVLSFVESLRMHSVSHHECPAAMEIAVTIATLEADIYPKVRDFNFHWSLNDKIRLAYDTDLHHPAPGKTYLCFDFQAITPLTTFVTFPPLGPGQV